jgi:hypothetical protein
VGKDRLVVVLLGQDNCGECLGEGSDLVGFDEDGVGGVRRDSFLQEFGIGDKQVVLDIGRLRRGHKPGEYEKIEKRIEKWLGEHS